MSLLQSFLENIVKNKSSFTNASSGKAFEERIINELKKLGFSNSLPDDSDLKEYLDTIKPSINAKTGSTLIENTLKEKGKQYINMFVWQPFGSQNYPDFLIFTEHKIFSIEIKYTEKNSKKPMWNSNLPKMDGIYIFGSYGTKDVTFFRGNDILPEDERKMLVEFWDLTDKVFNDWTKEHMEKFKNNEILKEYGFMPYIRKAWNQFKRFNVEDKEDSVVDFISNTNRKNLEKSCIEFVKSSDKGVELTEK